MNKRGLILSFSLIVLIVTVIVISFNFFFPKSAKLWQKAQSSPTPPALQAVELKETFALPVKKELLGTLPATASDSDRLVFFLAPRTPVYALISGKITYAGSKLSGETPEFENIIIRNQAKNLNASYLFSARSKLLVKEGDSVLEAEKIAEIDELSGGINCLGGANLGVTLIQNGKPVKLTKEMLR
ncbi:MAG: M23 family metallopeptidase [Patescibacteria group bacterium]|nr:M23 family metallopeptidase [Patescibacteria group bacterium]MCL5095636.1 M23 family metallopeptidase [Patescibacteria group bacterium]